MYRVNQSNFKLVTLIFIMILILTLMVGFYIIRMSRQSLFKQEQYTQTMQLEKLSHLIECFFYNNQNDVLFLSRSAWIKEYSRAQQAKEDINYLAQIKQQIIKDFENFIDIHFKYYQVRYIDEYGKEIIKLVKEGDKVSSIQAKNLFDVSNKSYYQQAMKLHAEEVYISQLDLDQEDHVIGVSYKPVIRYATPIFYPHGERAGIIIINVDAKLLLEKLDDVILLDSEGYYLHHPDKTKLWRREKDLNNQENFKKDLPQYAEQIFSNKSGKIKDKENMIHFTKINYHNGPDWILIFKTSKKSILETLDHVTMAFVMIVLIQIILFIILALILIDRRNMDEFERPLK